jgi:signal transduction histidine kinase
VVAAWTLFAVGCLIAMALWPGLETVPYHLGWAGFVLAFGLGTWSRLQLVTALTWYSLAGGSTLVSSWWEGLIGWGETTEIPLMLMLALLMVWHVRRRQAALAEVTRLAECDVQASIRREQLMQLTSHELRTPLTIARGYVELLQTRARESENQQDLGVVADELERLSRVSDRLIRMIRLQDDTTNEDVDIDQVMAQAVERWRVVADRHWILDARAGSGVGSPERLRTALDTLVENAIRYTSVGDTIRLVGSRDLRHIVVGVFDSGLGLSDQQVTAINAGERSSLPGTTAGTEAGADRDLAADSETDSDTDGDTRTGADFYPEDLLAGTGLGLSIVRALARAHGGTLQASHAPDGGAAMILTFPLDSPSEVGPLVLVAPSDSPPVPPELAERHATAMLVGPGAPKS